MAESEYKEQLKPGNKVWIRMVDPENPAKAYITVGADSELTYSGYQHLGTATFMIFDRVTGKGKKTSIETMTVNTLDIRHVGLIDVPNAD